MLPIAAISKSATTQGEKAIADPAHRGGHNTEPCPETALTQCLQA